MDLLAELKAKSSEINDLKMKLHLKEQDLQLAATLGQQLLEENNHLKSKAKNPDIDVDLIQEIQASLINQSRQLQHELAIEKEQKDTLLDQLKEIEAHSLNLKAECQSYLCKKAMAETNWNLQVKLSQIQQSNKDLEFELQKTTQELKRTKEKVEHLSKSNEKWIQKEQEWDKLQQNNKLLIHSLKIRIQQSLDKRKSSGSFCLESSGHHMAKKFINISVQTELDDSEKSRLEELASIVEQLEIELESKQAEFSNMESTKIEIERLYNDLQVRYEELVEVKNMFFPDQLQGLTFDGLNFSKEAEIDNGSQIKISGNDSKIAPDEKEYQCDDERPNKKELAIAIGQIDIDQISTVDPYEDSFDISSTFSTNGQSARPSIDQMHLNESIQKSQSNIDKRVIEFQKNATKMFDSRSTLADIEPKQKTHVESLTRTMLGSWFQKYNRRDKNPQMRYFWVNPYTRSLYWSAKPPVQGEYKPKCAKINSIQWTDPPQTQVRNFLPTPENSIIITTPTRKIRLLPISWSDHDSWVDGISTLLKRAFQNSAKDSVNTAQDCKALSASTFDECLAKFQNRENRTSFATSSPRLERKRINTVVYDDSEDDSTRNGIHRRVNTLKESVHRSNSTIPFPLHSQSPLKRPQSSRNK